MLDLTSSIRGWTRARRWGVWLVCLAATSSVAVGVALRMGFVFTQADAASYLAMAEGRPAQLPFAARQLGPLIVRGLMRGARLTVEQGFFVLGTCALVFFLGAVLFLLLSVERGTPRWMLAAVAGMFFWVTQYNGLVLPDLLYAALLAGFLLLLRRGWMLAAALMMLPLMLARESTLLTLACFLLAGWRRLRLHEAGAAVLAAGAGMLLVRRLTAGALPNAEGISPVVYLLAKLPWNFAKNFLGVVPWANVYRSCTVPRWQMAVRLGPLEALGVCGWSWRYPVWLLFEALATFGLLPLLVWKLRGRRGPSLPGREQVLLRFCVVYGVVSFALAGLLGEAFGRLFGYSWPLFLVALPLLVGASGGTFTSARAALAFLGLHLTLSWLNLELHEPLLVLPALMIWGAGGWLLRGSWRTGGVERAGT